MDPYLGRAKLRWFGVKRDREFDLFLRPFHLICLLAAMAVFCYRYLCLGTTDLSLKSLSFCYSLRMIPNIGLAH